MTDKQKKILTEDMKIARWPMTDKQKKYIIEDMKITRLSRIEFVVKDKYLVTIDENGLTRECTCPARTDYCKHMAKIDFFMYYANLGTFTLPKDYKVDIATQEDIDLYERQGRKEKK